MKIRLLGLLIALAPLFASASDIVWVEDSVPAGAWTGTDGGDSWNWVSNNPTSYIGTYAHQSALVASIHDHYFADATATLTVSPGDVLYTYVYLDPTNPPQEVMLRWSDGTSWFHAAYWGANLIPYGTNGTASQYPAGSLPAAGQWARLEVPASAVGLEGSTLTGMQFILSDGRATFDDSGVNSANSPLPSWVGLPMFNWKPRLGGVCWLISLAATEEAASYFTQFSRPVLVDIKTDGAGFGYRFDTNSWDPQEPEVASDGFPFDGTDTGTPTSPEDAFQIFGAMSNAEFVLNIPIPLNLTNSPDNDPNGTNQFGHDGWGYTWQTPEFYAAMVQYLFSTAGPTNEWQGLATNLDFFSQPTNFNWADLRARRGHVNPYPVVAVIIGTEPYNIDGENDGTSYGVQAEKFRVAIRNRGYTGPLGLHVGPQGFPDDPSDPDWFWQMMTNVTASDFSYLDLDHYYQFAGALEDFKRAYPISIDTNWPANWYPPNEWKSDYSKYLWIVEDTRNAISDDNTVPGLGDPSRWNLGWSEHGIQVSTGFGIYNDMFSAMHWGGWLAEMMRQNVAWDSAWVLFGQGFSTADLQIVENDTNSVTYVTRTPMFFVYQMAQQFYGYDYLTNSYVSSMGSTTNLYQTTQNTPNGDPVQYPWTTVRVFREPGTGTTRIHLFVVNQSTNNSATITGFENWECVAWTQIVGTNYADGDSLGVPGSEQILPTHARFPSLGAPIIIPPISVNHIVLVPPSLILGRSNPSSGIELADDTAFGRTGQWQQRGRQQLTLVDKNLSYFFNSFAHYQFKSSP